MLADAASEFDDLGDGFGVGLQPCLGLPGLQIAVGQLIQHRLEVVARGVEERVGAILDGAHDSGTLQPAVGVLVFAVGDREQQMSTRVLDAEFVEPPHDGQIAHLVGGQVDIRRAEDEWMVAFVAAGKKELA